ncbi:MAG TPA: protein kinase, partial [Terrimicrobiaceae bacterium]
MSADSVSIGTMVARVSLDDVIIYANDALAKYLNTPKRNLIGSSLVEVSRLCNGEISSCFARPETGRSINHLVTDDEGRIFEAQLYSRGGALDIILDETGAPEGRANELRQSSGTPFESLNEDELRTVRHPERRYLSVTYTQLERLAQFAGRLDPMEVKLIVDSFVEEASEAVRNTGCTVGEATRDAVLGIYGAPRYYAEHPLRAIIAACEQIQKASQLHAGLYREGKEWPPCSCGIWTGDTLVGVFGNSAWRHYTAIGAPVDLAESLCRLARPGEAILPEHTLTHMLRTLPEGWQHIRAESEHEPDLSGIEWSSGEMAPVPEHLRKVVYLVGRGVQEDPDRTELYFDYLWSFRVPGRDQPTPILRVVRPSLVSDSFELSEDNVVTTQATQALGKYKLVEVIGTGGMGTVWRGTDRFGNPLAIKILHSSEAVSKGQLKRFRREAEIMARLPHRNICRVYELNEFDGVQYIAMEYVDGIPLSDLLYGEGSTEDLSTEASSDLRVLIRSVRTGKASQSETAEPSESPPRPKTTRILPVEQTLSLILKVCDAVQFAHEHGVLHRDLKPANILLREDGEPL